MDEAKILEEFKPYIWAAVNRKFYYKYREDIVQDIYIELLEAIRKFDYSKNVPIGAYLSIRLKFAIHHITRRSMLNKGWIRFHNGKLEQRVKFVNLSSKCNISYNINISELTFIKERCNPKELKVLDLYLDGFSQTEIAKQFNVSISRISQILAKIKKYVN